MVHVVGLERPLSEEVDDMLEALTLTNPCLEPQNEHNGVAVIWPAQDGSKRGQCSIEGSWRILTMLDLGQELQIVF